MIYEMGRATLLIFLAELGDKTQILAMAFALQYSVRQVLSGVALGSMLNHGLAVVVGAYLSHVIPLPTIRFGSALMFLAFGIWNLRPEKDGESSAQKTFNSPILVVALAFFLGELGDKTQLTAIALASNSAFPWAILVGTVCGMVLTSLGGIFVGTKLGDRIPEFALKIISSAVFIGFGLFHLVQTVPPRFLTVTNITSFLVGLVALIFILIIPPLRFKSQVVARPGQLKQVAARLHGLDQILNKLCLNEEACRGERCPVGYCKRLIKEELNGEHDYKGRFNVIKPYVKKGQNFDRLKLQQALEILDQTNLNPSLYAEVKSSLNKLIS